MDKATPGQGLRPDCGRAFHAVYFQLEQLPEWFRTRAKTWFTFCYIDALSMKDTGCSESTVMAWVFRELYITSELHDLGLYIFSNGVRHHLKVGHAFYLGDDLSVYALASLKGVSARKPCFCLAVRGRIDEPMLADDPYFIHFRCPDKKRFKPCDSQTFALQCDEIQEHFEGGRTRLGKEKEIEYGIKWEPSGLVYDRQVRAIADIPNRVYWDWQHNVYSSGGLAQDHCNFIIEVFLNAEIATLESLDKFSQTVTMPKTQPPLSKRFFRDRYVPGGCRHIKAFASETMTCVEVLGIYLDQVLGDSGALAAEHTCFKLLRRLTWLFKLGDALGKDRHLQDLEETFAKYHDMAVNQFHTTQKIHYARHIEDCVRKYKKTWSCFPPERKHKAGKTVAKHSYKNLTRTMLAHDLLSLRAAFADPSTYEATALKNEVKLENLEALLGGDRVFGSVKARSPLGSFQKNEIVIWEIDGIVNAGIVNLFLRVASGQKSHLLVVCQKLRYVEASIFSGREDLPTFVPLALIKTHVAYQKLGSSYNLVLPLVW